MTSNYGNYREMAKNLRDCIYHSDPPSKYVLRSLFIIALHVEACATQDDCFVGDVREIISYIKEHPKWED
jgi:hypothetical protein